jgi:hypothetical protein
VAEPTEAQQKRAQARERRRSSGKPQEAESDDGASNADSSDGEQPLETVKHAAKIAAAGAAVGAAAAAARALASRSESEEEEPGPDDKAEAEPEADTERDRDQGQERDQPQEQSDQEPEPRSESEREPEAEADGEPAGERPGPDSEPRHNDDIQGATPDDAKTTVQRAREQLETLLERPVESVSAFERTQDGWFVTLEVVEVSRIPESTDVLASYQMELDDDRNLRRYDRVRRYRRSSADSGEGQ